MVRSLTERASATARRSSWCRGHSRRRRYSSGSSKARNRLAEARQEHRRDSATRLEADAKELATELDQLKQQRADTPTHVRAGDLPEQDSWTPCRFGGRLFLDVVRMIAYRAETRMMASVISAQGKKPNARRLLRALLTSDANIIPEPANGILRIQLLGLASDTCGPHARSPERFPGEPIQRSPAGLSTSRKSHLAGNNCGRKAGFLQSFHKECRQKELAEQRKANEERRIAERRAADDKRRS